MFQHRSSPLIIKLHVLMNSVDYSRGIAELNENLGDSFTSKNMEFLDAILDENLDKVKRLHEDGHGMEAYKQLNLRLAVGMSNIDILYWLFEHGYVNRSVEHIVGQLACTAFYDLLKRDNRFDLDDDEIIKCTHDSNYESRGRIRWYGRDNNVLREHIMASTDT